jgi:serine protease Do
MSHYQSPDPNFRLIPEATSGQPRRKATGYVGLTLLAALALILGGLYGPVLWQDWPVNAAPGARFQEAQLIQIEASLLEDQEAMAELYSQIAPSVVNIQVTSRLSARDLERFPFPGIPGLPGLPEGELPQQRGEGSGFIYDNDGHIVTNNHVVEGADEVVVVFNNGQWADGEVVATDPQSDLAVVKVTPPSGFEWRPLPLANPDTLRVGHTVLAMGNPFGLENTMTTGIVSALGRGMPVGRLGDSTYTLPDVIQTDAAINPGNSGGPLLNLAGEVVGVNFAIESATRSNSGVGFTIPVSIVARVVPALIENGRFDYAYLGLSGTSIGPDVADALELDNQTLGVYVSSVVPNGPSDQAGIQGARSSVSTNGGTGLNPGGDIITAIDDQPVTRFEELVSYLVTKASPGDTVTLTVLRDGETLEIDVVLGTRPGQQESTAARSEGPINARQAIEIAMGAVEDVLSGPIVERTVAPDVHEGQEVWVVELSTARQTATVIVSQATGEVLEMNVD